MPLLQVDSEQQSALVAHGPPETQQTMPAKPVLFEQTTLSFAPVILSQQSKLLKHGSRSSLQAQTPPRQTPDPHSAAKVHGAPLLLLSQVPPGQSPEQQLLAPVKGQVSPATWQQPQVIRLRT